MDKRQFVKTLGGASLGLMFSPSVLARYMAMPHTELAQDEAFWGSINVLVRALRELAAAA